MADHHHIRPDEIDQVVEERLHARRWRRAWTIVRDGVAITSGVLLIAVLIIVLINQRALRERVDETHEAARSSAQTLAILKDCLTPGGVCYRRSQASTSDVLTKVKTIFEYVELCGKDPSLSHDVHGLDGCVVSLIKEHGL